MRRPHLPRPPRIDTRTLAERYDELEHRRRIGFPLAVTRRFFQIDGPTHGGLLAVELFTTMIPLAILGYAAFTRFDPNAYVGDLFNQQLGIREPLARVVRDAFDSSNQLKAAFTFTGLASFLFWGIPMSITVSTMFNRAWRREPYPMGSRILRGAVWFALYLAVLLTQQWFATHGSNNLLRFTYFLAGLIPAFVLWALSPVLLVRQGARAPRAVLLSGLAGMVIMSVIVRPLGRLLFPYLLFGWKGFGPIGVALTLMTWAGIQGVGWVMSACAGAVVWERWADAHDVIDAETIGSEPDAGTVGN